jgi:DNA replication protein DnaC
MRLAMATALRASANKLQRWCEIGAHAAAGDGVAGIQQRLEALDIFRARGSLCGHPAGVGKSWLASALGHKACRDNRSVLYQRIPKLFADLALARGDGRYARLLRALGGVQLLILDDWGLEPLDAAARHELLEILEERYGRRSTIITSQIPLYKWHELIGDPTYADAILDRIVHNAHRINLTGHSLRRSRSNKASKD